MIAPRPPTGGQVTPDTAICQPAPAISLTEADAERLARGLKAVADPTRLRLMALLAASDQGGLCVGEMTAALNSSQSTISHHLKILLDVHLVTRQAHGSKRCYFAVPAAIHTLAELFTTGPVSIS